MTRDTQVQQVNLIQFRVLAYTVMESSWGGPCPTTTLTCYKLGHADTNKEPQTCEEGWQEKGKQQQLLNLMPHLGKKHANDGPIGFSQDDKPKVIPKHRRIL